MDASNFSDDAWEQCVQLLRRIARDPSLIDDKPEFKTLIAKINKRGRKTLRQKELERKRTADRAKTNTIIQQRETIAHDALPSGNENVSDLSLQQSKTCYICKEPYWQLHFFYHLLCPDCASLNYEKREQKHDLTGYNVLITGGRIKIGYQTALHCLRNGATVYATTRFPQDALKRYQQERDFSTWQSRLYIYGVDLRRIVSVDELISYLHQHVSHLDILINNAAQTIKRPLQFYQHLLTESAVTTPKNLVQPTIDLLESQSDLLQSGELAPYFPQDEWDEHGQRVDKRVANSWSATLADVDIRELVEVQLVNSIAPFILCSRLKPMFLKSPNARRFIVNVSAMEGQFGRKNKTHYHPHTNMAKAALNMLTRTSASDYAADNIYMNSVDTGWITDENPYPKSMRLKANGFHPPLDIIDGRARLLAPIYTGLARSETPLYGHFLKDYEPYPW